MKEITEISEETGYKTDKDYKEAISAKMEGGIHEVLEGEVKTQLTIEVKFERSFNKKTKTVTETTRELSFTPCAAQCKRIEYPYGPITHFHLQCSVKLTRKYVISRGSFVWKPLSSALGAAQVETLFADVKIYSFTQATLFDAEVGPCNCKECKNKCKDGPIVYPVPQDKEEHKTPPRAPPDTPPKAPPDTPPDTPPDPNEPDPNEPG